MLLSFAKKAVIGLTIVVLGLASHNALAAEVTAGGDFVSGYIWRGITFNDEGVFQPYVDVSHPAGVSFNVWGNLDLGDFENTLEEGEFSEVDLTLTYQIPIEAFDLSIGFIHYLFPETGSDAATSEYFISAGVGLWEGGSFGAALYHDIDEVNDIYVYLSLGQDLTAWPFMDIPEEWSFDFTFGTGIWGDEFAAAYGGTDSGASHWDARFDLAYALTESVSINGFFVFTGNYDEDVLPDQPADAFGGGGLSYTF